LQYLIAEAWKNTEENGKNPVVGNISINILDSVKDDLQSYYNFRMCIEAGEKLTLALRHVRLKIIYICKMLNAIIILSNLKGNYTRKSNMQIYKHKHKHQ
jgi:hypothetical protein